MKRLGKPVTLSHVAGFIKHCQGMCADERSCMDIWRELQKLLTLLRSTEEFKTMRRTQIKALKQR